MMDEFSLKACGCVTPHALSLAHAGLIGFDQNPNMNATSILKHFQSTGRLL
jgi:hypothetical protein